MSLTSSATALLLSLIGPGADASFFVVYQAFRTGDSVELAINTVVEFAAFFRVLVRKVTIQTGAVQ